MNCQHCGGDILTRAKKFCSAECYHADERAQKDASIASGQKRCPRCQVTKALRDFSPCRSNYDGLSGWCRRCRAENESARLKSPRVIDRFHTRYETDLRFRARHFLRITLKRTRRSGLAFDLDVDWLESRLKAGRCELTRLPFDLSVRTRKPTAYSPSIDRIEPGGGYTKANCRLVLHAVNLWLKDYTLDRFMPIAEALVDAYRAKRGRVA